MQASGVHAPEHSDHPATEPYLVAHHLLLAHAKAYHIYHDEFASTQNGMVGIANSGDYRYPKSNDKSLDQEAAERAMLFQFGWFVDPLIKGDYPPAMRERLGDRLPAFTKQERTYIMGTVDFLGLNYYSSLLATTPDHEEEWSGYWADIFVNFR